MRTAQEQIAAGELIIDWEPGMTAEQYQQALAFFDKSRAQALRDKQRKTPPKRRKRPSTDQRHRFGNLL